MNRLQFSLWLTDKSVNEFRNRVEWCWFKKNNIARTHTRHVLSEKKKRTERVLKKMKELSFHTKETLTHLFHCEIVGQFGFSFFSFFFYVFILYLLVYHFHIATLHSMQKIKQRYLKFIDDGDGCGRRTVAWVLLGSTEERIKAILHYIFGAHISNVMKQCFDRFCFDSNAYENKYNIIRHCCKNRSASIRAYVCTLFLNERTTKTCCCCCSCWWWWCCRCCYIPAVA